MPKSLQKYIEKIRKEVRRKTENLIFSHKFVVYFTLTFLFLSYIAIFFIDIRNIFGLRSVFDGFLVPFFWDRLFMEAGPVENIQWIFLTCFILLSSWLSFTTKNEDGFTDESIFWMLFAVAGVFMVLEDVGNIRHIMIRRNPNLSWIMRNTLETLFFGLLGSLPVLAVVKYRKNIFRSKTTSKLLLLGFVFYICAATLSGPVEVTDIDTEIGNKFYEFSVFFGGEDFREAFEEGDRRIESIEKEKDIIMMDVRTRFTDFVVEESLELLGATFLLASALSYKEFIST